jgi:hypothetical protein
VASTCPRRRAIAGFHGGEPRGIRRDGAGGADPRGRHRRGRRADGRPHGAARAHGGARWAAGHHRRACGGRRRGGAARRGRGRGRGAARHHGGDQAGRGARRGAGRRWHRRADDGRAGGDGDGAAASAAAAAFRSADRPRRPGAAVRSAAGTARAGRRASALRAARGNQHAGCASRAAAGGCAPCRPGPANLWPREAGTAGGVIRGRAARRRVAERRDAGSGHDRSRRRALPVQDRGRRGGRDGSASRRAAVERRGIRNRDRSGRTATAAASSSMGISGSHWRRGYRARAKTRASGRSCSARPMV